MSEQTILAINTSKSNPAKQHRIIEGRDGVIYCECMGWKMHRDCRHLREFHAGTKNQFATNKKPQPRVPPTTRPSLQEQIDLAVEMINNGGK